MRGQAVPVPPNGILLDDNQALRRTHPFHPEAGWRGVLTRPEIGAIPAIIEIKPAPDVRHANYTNAFAISEQ